MQEDRRGSAEEVWTEQDYSGSMWFLVDVVAVAVLALAMAYGIWKWRARLRMTRHPNAPATKERSAAIRASRRNRNSGRGRLAAGTPAPSAAIPSAGRYNDVPEVVGLGRSARTPSKPAFASAAMISSGARVVKMSLGRPMRSIRSFSKNPTITRPPGESTQWISVKPVSSMASAGAPASPLFTCRDTRQCLVPRAGNARPICGARAATAYFTVSRLTDALV
jgi:hypothetical protein